MTARERQSNFAKEIVFNNKSEKEAYIAAYDISPGTTERQIATRASKVFNGKFVQSEIERFRKECAEFDVISKKELLTDLVEVYRVAKENSYQVVEAPDGSTIKVLVPKAADVFAKLADRIANMIGANAPEKVENVVNFEFDEEFDKYAN